MYKPGQILDYQIGAKTTRKVVFVKMSKSGKRAFIHPVEKSKWYGMYVRPDKLKARDGAA